MCLTAEPLVQTVVLVAYRQSPTAKGIGRANGMEHRLCLQPKRGSPQRFSRFFAQKRMNHNALADSSGSYKSLTAQAI